MRIPGLPGDVFRIWGTSGLSDCPRRWQPRSKLFFQRGELIEASEFLLGASRPSFHAVFPITRRILWFVIYCNAETIHGVIKDNGLQIWEENVRKWQKMWESGCLAPSLLMECLSLDQADLEILVLDYSKRRDLLQGPPDSEAFPKTGRLGVKWIWPYLIMFDGNPFFFFILHCLWFSWNISNTKVPRLFNKLHSHKQSRQRRKGNTKMMGRKEKTGFDVLANNYLQVRHKVSWTWVFFLQFLGQI